MGDIRRGFMPWQSQGRHDLTCVAPPVAAAHVQPAYTLLQS